MTLNINNINWEKVSGLVPAIVQDQTTKSVLMLGYMNQNALQKTLETNLVTFFSRTRQCLWTKGETSGNTLTLNTIKIDCDKDTLLVSVTPTGPACHTGSYTCFNETNDDPIGHLKSLNATIKARRLADSGDSYTARLFESGIKRISQKVGEEALEVALAATSNDRDELIEESADLIYHLLVLWQASNLPPNEVIACLKSRAE